MHCVYNKEKKIKSSGRETKKKHLNDMLMMLKSIYRINPDELVQLHKIATF